MTLLLVAIVLFIGILIGKLSSKTSYDGQILTDVTEAGTKRYTSNVIVYNQRSCLEEVADTGSV